MHDYKLVDEISRGDALGRHEAPDVPIDAAFDRITNLVCKLLDVPIAAVSLIDSDGQKRTAPAGLDIAQDNGLHDNPRVAGHSGSYAGVPLEAPDGHSLGTLCAIDTQPRRFDADQIEILRDLAALVVDQLELRRIAEQDSLSGALTRRAFIAELDKTITLFSRHGRPASLLMIDIDHFKRINDSYGHPAGDQVIRTLAETCGALSRPSDSLGRLGGEEFGLLLPETPPGDALRLAQRLRCAIGKNRVEHDPPLRVTASIGVAGLSADRSNSDLWLAAADVAMYQAKHDGRDRVAVAAD